MQRYKRMALIISLIFFMTLCLAVKPVRASISDALSIFRVKNVKNINLTLDDLTNMEEAFRSHNSDICLDKMGKITIHGGETRDISRYEAERIPNMKVLFPSEASANILKISAAEPETLNFTLKVMNINELLKTFGAKEGFPANLNGKTFSITIPALVNISLSLKGNNFTIVETKYPELAVPGDVDVNKMYDAIIELPVIPENLKKQLESIKDWKKTLYMPVVEGVMEEVDINNCIGYIYKTDGNSNLRWAVIWHDSENFYGINGTGSREEILIVARSMK